MRFWLWERLPAAIMRWQLKSDFFSRLEAAPTRNGCKFDDINPQFLEVSYNRYCRPRKPLKMRFNVQRNSFHLKKTEWSDTGNIQYWQTRKKSETPSCLRRQASRTIWKYWIPAFAGMTSKDVLRLFTKPSIFNVGLSGLGYWGMAIGPGAYSPKVNQCKVTLNVELWTCERLSKWKK